VTYCISASPTEATLKLYPRHAWDLTPSEAVALQKRLRGQVAIDRPIDLSSVHLVAGVDVSVKNERSRAAVVVVTFPGFLVVEIATAERPTPFPYVPGLLSFRGTPNHRRR
jgi:deoxyribonuclease V